ncbi:FtsX-like permease family protein [Lacrimispora sp.]|uniref:ABC transporter permease n=1 Tax=Lacrimispora sp. TaxID=2719234 RepID=UPI003460113B
MALNKRIWRTLSEHKGRYIGIFILIFLGSFTFIAAKGFGDNYERLVSDFAQNNWQEDISFSIDRPLEDIAALERESNAAIESYRYYDLPLTGSGELRLLTPQQKVNIPAVTSGKGLQNAGDILIDPFFAANHGLEIGDKVDDAEKIFEIAGTMALPHYVYPLKYINDILPPSGFGIGLVSQKDMDAFPEAVTVYAARFADRDNIDGQIISLRNALNRQGVQVSDWIDAENNKRIRMPWATITGAKTMAVPLPVAMFFLCCLIVGVIIWRTVKADSVIIGTLYAQGYRRRELVRHYLAIPLLLAAAGGMTGVFLGLVTIDPAVSYMANSYYIIPYQKLVISVSDVLAGILLPMAFLGLAALLVTRRELGKTAGELMKGGRGKAKVNFLESRLGLERFTFHTRFQLREQLRSIPQLLFLLFGVTAASMMMLFGFTINHSMNAVFQSGTDGMYNYAWEYSFKETRRGEVPDGAAPFNALRCYPQGKENAEFYLTGIEPDAGGIILRGADGKILPKNQVNITRPMADRLKLRVGSLVTFVSKLDGQIYELAVDGIIETYAGQFIYLPLDAFNSLTGQPEGSYTGVFSTEVLPYEEWELSGVKDLQNLNNAMDYLAAPIILAAVFMTVIAGLMGAIIIFLVTSLMIEENRGTISLLKVFGYREKEIGSLILDGSTWVVVAGFALGVPLMLAAAGAMYAYLGEMINMVLPIILSPVYVLISFVLIIAVYLLTRRFSGRKLLNISMSEALKAGSE